MGCVQTKSGAVKETVEQPVQSTLPTLLESSEQQDKETHLPASYKVVLQSIDGRTLADIEVDGSATVADLLQHLCREGDHRICTLLLDKRKLHPIWHVERYGSGISAYPAIGLSADATNYVTAVFWSVDGLKQIGLNAQKLIHEKRQKGLIAAMCNGQHRSDYMLKPEGYSVRELKETGFSVNELKECRCLLSELLAAGFTVEDCKTAGYEAWEFRVAGWSNDQLQAAGFTSSELAKRAGSR